MGGDRAREGTATVNSTILCTISPAALMTLAANILLGAEEPRTIGPKPAHHRDVADPKITITNQT
jgi:hypothetical protein